MIVEQLMEPHIPCAETARNTGRGGRARTQLPRDLHRLQVLDAMRADPGLADTRVIMVTARGQANGCEIGMAPCAHACFIKPFSPIARFNTIRDMLK